GTRHRDGHSLSDPDPPAAGLGGPRLQARRVSRRREGGGPGAVPSDLPGAHRGSGRGGSRPPQRGSSPPNRRLTNPLPLALRGGGFFYMGREQVWRVGRGGGVGARSARLVAVRAAGPLAAR